jgi:hypothetical protein
MDSLGSWSMIDRATVRPPTPESKTPMGRDPNSAAGWAPLGPVAVLLAGLSAAAAAGSVLDAEVMIIRG